MILKTNNDGFVKNRHMNKEYRCELGKVFKKADNDAVARSKFDENTRNWSCWELVHAAGLFILSSL